MQENKMQAVNAKDVSKEDFKVYLQSKPTEFLTGLSKTGLNALGSERHQQVKEELTERGA